jgi:hypothetical protein
MLFSELNYMLAWSSSGHVDLTSFSVASAVVNLIRFASKELVTKLAILGMVKKRYGLALDEFGGGGYSPDIKISSLKSRHHLTEDDIRILLWGLPKEVANEDLHLGNIPWGIGERVDKNGQVRHYMRSEPKTTAKEAHEASLDYIWNNILAAWSSMKAALETLDSDQTHLSKALQNLSRFNEGRHSLAKALHTVEDSYSPGHVRRKEGVGTILDVYRWDDANKKPRPPDWLGHDAYDDRKSNPVSRYFFDMAVRSTGRIIFCLLKDLDQDEKGFTKEFGTILDSSFHMGDLKQD